MGKGTISLRPERIALEAEPGPALIAGRITSVTYLGSRYEYMVEAPFGPLLVSVPVGGRRFEAGAAVGIGISPETATIVETEE